MSTAVLDRLRSERDECRSAALALISAEDYDPSSEALKSLEERGSALDTQIERLVKVLDSQSAADALDGRIAKSHQAQERAAAQPETRESWGEAFTRSDVFANYAGRGTSARFEVEMRALPATLSSMGDALKAAPVYDTTPPVLPPSLLPLVSVIDVSQNSVDYISWSKAAGSAAIVPEGAKKPEIEWTPSVTSASLDTIAATTSYSRQLAQDAAAIVSYINGELQNEIRRKIEEEAQAALAAATLDSVSGSDLISALRVGMAKVQANGYVPNGFTVSAEDLATMDLAVMGATVGGPVRTNSYWGLTPVVDWTKSAGDPITVGDFRRGIQHYRRTAVQLFTTDSHGDHFVYNLLDTVAEARVKTVVVRPDALVEATG